MATKKLTANEARAKVWAEGVRAGETIGTIIVVWRKSRTWGHNPSVQSPGGWQLGSASGCGYHKGSAALAEALQFLGETDEDRLAIGRCAGAGLGTLQAALAKLGWALVQTYDGRSEEGYTVERMAPAGDA